MKYDIKRNGKVAATLDTAEIRDIAEFFDLECIKEYVENNYDKYSNAEIEKIARAAKDMKDEDCIPEGDAIYYSMEHLVKTKGIRDFGYTK